VLLVHRALLVLRRPALSPPKNTNCGAVEKGATAGEIQVR